MPAERTARKLETGSAASGRLSKKVQVEPCDICGLVVSRRSDLMRHKKRHDRTAKKFPCPWEGCKYSTLQKSNLATHYRRHTGDKSFVCTDSPRDCDFQSCDPASLHRHRKSQHGYKPKGRKVSSLNDYSSWDLSILSDIPSSQY